MTNQNTALFGIFKKRSEIDEAIQMLKKVGFASKDITIMFPEEQGPQDFPQVQKNQLFNGALLGAIVGVIVVGTIGGFMAAGAFPSFSFSNSNTSMAGPILTVILSVFIGGVAGGACGLLVGIGTPDPAAKRYGQYVHAGGILLSVQSTNSQQLESAKAILDQSGAEDINAIDEIDGWQEAVQEEHVLVHLDRVDPVDSDPRPTENSPQA